MEFLKELLQTEDAEPEIIDISEITGSEEYLDISDSHLLSVLDSEDDIFKQITEPNSQVHSPVTGPSPSSLTQFVPHDKGRVCRKCGKNIKKTQLSSHVCDRERKFQCRFCSAAFWQLPTLKQHYAVHSSTKPHTCEICFNSYSRRSTLIMHKKTHGGTKAFACTICGKAFHQKGNLKNHIYTHSNARPYKCEICEVGFNQRSNLACHRKKFHNEESENINPLGSLQQHGDPLAFLLKHNTLKNDKPLKVRHHNGQDATEAYNSLPFSVVPLFGPDGSVVEYLKMDQL